jgi:WD repeat-containing protein 42A
VISCAADCEVRAFNVNYDQAGQTTCTNLYTDHERRVKRLCTFDNPNTFVSASEDGTVRLFDLRERTGHIVVNLDEIEIHSIAVYNNFFCLGANDPIIRVYDIRNYSPSSSESVSVYASFSPQHLYNNREMSFVRGHVTGVSFHRDEILASYSGDDIYLFNLKTTTENGFSSRKRKREADTVNTAAKTFVQSYSGHCNIRTVKGVSFFGTEAEYVASGSDDGRIFIWEKVTSKLVNIMKGDKQTVNVISGHPNNCVMASSGIDNDVKIWEPILEEPVDLSSIEEIIEENRQRSLIASNPLAWIMDRVGIDDEEDADENNFTCAYQ